MIGRIGRNAASLAGAQLVMKAAGLAATILIARALQADGFGRFAAAWSFGMLVGVLADGGLAYFVALEVARVPRIARRFVWTAFALRGGICALGLGLALAVLPLLRFDRPLAGAALLFALAALLDGLASQALAYFRAAARMHVEASVISAGRVAFVAATGLAFAFDRTLAGFALAQLAASALTAALALRTLARALPVCRPRLRASLAVARGALPFAASGLLTYVYFRLDVLLLRALGVADGAVGAYSAAYRVMEAPRTAFGSIAAGMLPEVAALAHPRDRDAFKRLAARVAVVTLWTVVPAAVVFALAPATVVRLIFGPGFGQAALLLAVLAPMPPLMALDAILVSLVNALGGQRTVTAVFALCSLANVTLNLWLIPRHGALGAALATVGTEAVQLAALLIVVRRRVGALRPGLGSLAVASAASLGAGAVAPDGIARIAAALGVYATLAFALARRRAVAA